MPNGKTYGRVYRMRAMDRGAGYDGNHTITVTIPRKIRERLGIKGGDILLVSNERGRCIKIRPLSEETEADRKNSVKQLHEKDFVEVKEEKPKRKSYRQKVHDGEIFQKKIWK